MWHDLRVSRNHTLIEFKFKEQIKETCQVPKKIFKDQNVKNCQVH